MHAAPRRGEHRSSPARSRAGPRAARRARAVVPLALALCSCGYPTALGHRLEQRVDHLEGEGAARPPGEGGAAMQELVRRLDARLAAMQRELDALGATAQQGGSDRAARLDATGEETRRLRATLEQQAQRLDAIERTLALTRAASQEQRASKPAARQAERRRTLAPEGPPDETLAAAAEQEAKGERAVARALYEELSARAPDDPAAAEAHFRLGALAFEERRFRDALLEYGKVAKEFPRSGRAAEALVQTAESLVRLELREDAVVLLGEVPGRYPGTPAAERARRRLAELAAAPAGRPK